MFRFAPWPAEPARINGYAPGERLELLLAAFDPGGTTGLLAGPLGAQPGRFLANMTDAATTAEARLVHETDSGRLMFDPDGNGPIASALVVTLGGAAAVAAGDLVIV